MSKTVQERLSDLMATWTEEIDNYCGVIYQRLYPFSVHPSSYSISWKTDGELVWCLNENKPDFHRTHETIDFDNAKIIKALKENGHVIVYPVTAYEFYIVGTTVPFFMNIMCDGRHDHDALLSIMTEDIDATMSNIRDCFIKKEKKDNCSEFGIATIADGQLYTSWYDMKKKFDIDIKKQYNDDLPYDRICDIIHDETKADLILFYGEPGTGKSTLIKHLITEFPDKQFIFLESSILSSIQPAKFIAYLTENENSVLILEDCEKVLRSRDAGNGGMMSTILNITDGVISDILGIKLICTFNTTLANIDKALLRKGRLSLKYEFKKLAKEKAMVLGADGDSILADIFNKDENDYSKTQRTKIGF